MCLMNPTEESLGWEFHPSLIAFLVRGQSSCSFLGGQPKDHRSRQQDRGRFGRSANSTTRSMRLTVGVLAVLATTASCFSVRTLSTAATHSAGLTSTRLSSTQNKSALRLRRHQASMISKAERVARGGGGEGGGTGGFLARASCLPFLKILPPQV